MTMVKEEQDMHGEKQTGVRPLLNECVQGYNSIKVWLAPIQDLFNSRPVLSSRLALSDQRRVRCKQNSF